MFQVYRFSSQMDKKCILLLFWKCTEPRKIAHQLLTVRENICEEIVEDISSLKAEHDEALRYAQTLMKSGKEAAEKGRRDTRYYGGTSTPHRTKNFHDVSSLITFAAVEATKADLKRRRDTLSVEILDDLLKRCVADDNPSNPAQIAIFTRNAPRFIIEELCNRGVIDGVHTQDGKSVNILKLAEGLMKKR